MLTARLIPLTFRSLACAALPLVAACTSSTMRSGDPSTPLADLGRVFHLGGEDSENRDHRQTQTINGVTVAARLLPDDEAQSLYQADLASKGVQAVWLSITNKSPGEQWMLAAYLDPDYYTADEAAHLFRKTWGGIGHRSLQQRFRDLSMRARLEAGKSYEGHVLVPRTEGGRYVEIITNGHGSVRRFGFPLRTPDGHFDFERMHPAAIYEGMKLPDLTRDQLRTRLEQLPPTVTDAKGSAQGDPLNFVLVGDTAQMMAALSECGWAFTHRIDGTTVRRMITAALRGELDNVDYKEHVVFGVKYPTSCPNVPSEILDARGTWADKADYDSTADKLAKQFVANFDKYKDGAGQEILSAAPKTAVKA